MRYNFLVKNSQIVNEFISSTVSVLGFKKNHKIDTLLGLIQDIVKHCLIKSVTVELDLP